MEIGIDIGGTFTDILAITKDNKYFSGKVLSTPDDYSVGVGQAIAKLLEEFNESNVLIKSIMHASTIATNAILERKGAKTALLVTKGFEDILYLGRMKRPDSYDFFCLPQNPLVPRYLTTGVKERTNSSGEIIYSVEEKDVRKILEKMKSEGIEALAISFLFSFLNSENERKVKEIASQILPEAFICESSCIVPKIREYERTATTVANAYIGPVVKKYIEGIQQVLDRYNINENTLLIMQSNGGVVSPSIIKEKPIMIVESGPAAGAIAAAKIAQELGYSKALSLDMGGTSAKASLSFNGAVQFRDDYELNPGVITKARLSRGTGIPVYLPVVDLAEVGAGGGSIAWIDSGGVLRVGPQSAGAMPGPACYGKGGTEATVTDAYLILGWLDPEYKLGGTLELNYDAAVKSIEKIGRKIGFNIYETADLIKNIANLTMLKALRIVSVERGYDPLECVLVAFGGAGPVCAASLASELGICEVLIPPSAGVLSACGLVAADWKVCLERTWLKRAKESNEIINVINPEELEEEFKKMEKEVLKAAFKDGWEKKHIEIKRSADMRYSGQGYEIRVDNIPRSILNRAILQQIITNFLKKYKQTYGCSVEDESVEIVNIRVEGEVRRNSLVLLASPYQSSSLTNQSDKVRNAWFEGKSFSTEAYRAEKIPENKKVRGPAVIHSTHCTVVIPPGWEAYKFLGGVFKLTYNNLKG